MMEGDKSLLLNVQFSNNKRGPPQRKRHYCVLYLAE